MENPNSESTVGDQDDAATATCDSNSSIAILDFALRLIFEGEMPRRNQRNIPPFSFASGSRSKRR